MTPKENDAVAITRINQFKAKAGRGPELREFLQSVIGMIRGSAGSRSCELLQATDQPERFAIIEVWDSVAAHQAAAKAIPPSKVQAVMPLLEAPATGAYFRVVGAGT
jgi:heme-degrading monooxygenase HmoA